MHGGGPAWLDAGEVIDPEFANNRHDRAIGMNIDERDANQVRNEYITFIHVRNELARVKCISSLQPLAAQQDEHRQEAPAVAVDDQNNWNPVEWDRAEELTWERLLGLDGSLVFLEHVFWVVSLNTLFIVIFAFLPYNIGTLFINLCELKEYASASRFEGMYDYIRQILKSNTRK